VTPITTPPSARFEPRLGVSHSKVTILGLHLGRRLRHLPKCAPKGGALGSESQAPRHALGEACSGEARPVSCMESQETKFVSLFCMHSPL
jgi:hypothetical protein